MTAAVAAAVGAAVDAVLVVSTADDVVWQNVLSEVKCLLSLPFSTSS